MDTNENITHLLKEWASGSEQGLNELLPLVLDDLRRLAAHHLAKQGSSPTLQPTVLVNEAYFRFKSAKIKGFDSRTHFFAFASTVIRGVLVDHARARKARKRGAGEIHFELDDQLQGGSPGFDLDTVLTLDQFLTKLESTHPRQSRVLELHLFSGLTLPEISHALGKSQATIERDWALGRRYLARELRPSPEAP